MKRITSFMSIKEVILGFITAIILTLGLYVGVQATWVYNGTIFGRSSYHGYFDDNPYGEHEYGDDVLPSDPSTSMAIPDFSNTADPDDQFIIFLKSANNWRGENPYASQQQVTGSAFIVNTMLGRNGPGNGKNISDIDWQTLTDLLDSYQKKGNIKWNKDSGPRDINSYYQKKGGSGYDDDAFYGSWTSGESIYIKNDDGSVAYILLRACANPTGQFDNLKDTTKKWNIAATSTSNKVEAYPGDTIHWTHTLTNNGPTATSTNIHSNLALSGFTNGWAGTVADGDTGAPAGPGVIRTIASYATYTVGANDVGHTLCEKVQYDPINSGGDRNGRGNNSCVTISSPPLTSNGCNPIANIVADPNTNPSVSASPHNPGSFPAISSRPQAFNIVVTNNTTGVSQTIRSNVTSHTVITNLTSIYTTGDLYTITYPETGSHVTGYSDNMTNGIEYFKDKFWVVDQKAIVGPPAVAEVGHWDTTTFDHWQYDPARYADTTITYSAGPGSANGTLSSIGPCYNYVLTANISSFNAFVEPGANITVNPTVAVSPYVSDIPTTHSRSTQWQITQMIVPPNRFLNSVGGNSSSDPCSFYDPGRISQCRSVNSGNTIFGPSDGGVGQFNYPVGDQPAGTKYCYAFSVQPRAALNKDFVDNDWSHSAFSAFDPALNCVIIVKKPKVQIWGGDLWVNGAIRASNSVKNIANVNRTFGSWAEYGIFATGSITGIASGSVFAGPGLADSTICKYNILSFVNAVSPVAPFCTGIGIGNYSSNHSIPDVAASFSGAGTAISGNVTPSSLDSGIYSGNNLTLATSELAPGKSIIIKASGTVTIVGNQTYNQDNNGSKYKSGLQLPQLVIIADKIIINHDVINVDAWLVAKGNNGTIETCDIVGDTANKCNLMLTVNGPVMAQKLYLRRTAGSGVEAASGNPAEIFNLRADAYLWAAAQSSISSRAQTVYITELPPRF